MIFVFAIPSVYYMRVHLLIQVPPYMFTRQGWITLKNVRGVYELLFILRVLSLLFTHLNKAEVI